jgi:hypothetical protein
MKMRHDLPDEFEVISDNVRTSGRIYTKAMRSATSHIHDSLFLFVDMTEKYYVLKVSRTIQCPHIAYEQQRLLKLHDALTEICDTWETEETATLLERNSLKALDLNSLIVKLAEWQTLLANRNLDQLWDKYKECTSSCMNILQQLRVFGLPYDVKPMWADLTDAGPGVGVSNFEVRFRDTEMARIWKSDYRIRVHRSRNDSHMNEAERTNSAIGDALVDGGTIEWERQKLFEGLTDEQISNLTLNEFEEHQKQIMRKNALDVTDEVVQRLDGAPALGEFITKLLLKIGNSFSIKITYMHSTSQIKVIVLLEPHIL